MTGDFDTAVRSILSQLVEAQKDQSDADKRLQDYRAAKRPPEVPNDFEDVDAFLDYHHRRQSYENYLRQHENALKKAKKGYADAADQLRLFLPDGVPLRYTYEGERSELFNTEYVIVRKQGEIVIATYRYAFPVQDRGGTYWYHPHPHGGTARQTYAGLAGLFLVEDEDERRLGEALDLRLGETDIPLLIQDKILDEDGNFVYKPDTMAVDMGYEGDVILVNLTPTPYLEVGTRIYRFRLLNGSNARTYRVAFTKAGEEELLSYQVIGTDGGLLDHPREVSEAFLSPGERMEVLLDLRDFEVGEEVVLRSLPFDPMHREHEMEMGGEMEHMDHMDMGYHHHMGPARLPDGSEFYLLRLAIKERTDYTRRVPEKLSDIPQPDFADAASRPITISMTTDDQGMRWLINGRTHSMDEVPIVVQRGAMEVWEIHNDEKSMPHPAHLHGFQFRIVERADTPEQLAHLAVDEKGRLVTDVGFKDTVLLWPGETVKCAMDFSHGFEGEQLYMFHCHILEHETGMMLNLKIVDPPG